ncbi:MAG: cell division septal protein [Blautia sp.]|nr:cell division septal protein [Blautia sp.]
MRESEYRKQIKIDKKTKYAIYGVVSVLLLTGLIFFFVYFKVDNIEVMASSHYTEEEIKSMVLRGPLASNSVLAPILYSKKNTKDVPFVESFSVEQIDRHTIAVGVKEVRPVGCIPYLDSYVYFDREGIFIEGTKSRDMSVPFFDGIQVSYVIMGQELPIKGKAIMNTAVALATIFQKNDLVPDHIQFDDNSQISLLYGDITVMLGKDEFLEDKMARVIAILPKISGKKGILHAESVSDNLKNITFEEEKLQISPDQWNGGYDENGEYTGEGEYDEEGNHVGPKPEGMEETEEGEDTLASGDYSYGYGYSDTYGDSYGDNYKKPYDNVNKEPYDNTSYDSYDSYDSGDDAYNSYG